MVVANAIKFQDKTEERELQLVFKLNPVKPLAPPEPLPDAKGSLSHARLVKMAQNHQPPAVWLEGDEEDLF